MLKTNLVVGDKVILGDVWSGKDAEKVKGIGYVVTAIGKNHIECTHNTLPFGDFNKVKNYGANDLHHITVKV